jgi:hypothetical protein
VRNWVRMALNACRRARKKDRKDDHDMQPPPDDEPYSVAAVCTVVFPVYSALRRLSASGGRSEPHSRRLLSFAVIDNMLQIISIFIILKGQDAETAR